MKKIFRMALVFALAGATLMYTGCTKDYSEDINGLSSDVATLNSNLQTLQQDVNTLKSSVSALESAYKAADAALQKAIDGNTSEIAALKTAVDALKVQVAAGETKIAAAEDAIKTLENASKTHATKDELNAAKTALEGQISTLKNELLAAGEALQAALDLVKADVAANKAAIDGNKVEISKNAADILAANAKILKNAEDILANAGAIKGAQAAIEALKADVAALQTKVADLEAAVAANKTAIEANADEIDAIKAAYATKEELAALEEKLQGAQGDLNELFSLLSNELRSIVFLPDFYFAGIEATSFDIAEIYSYVPVENKKDVKEGDFVFPKTAKLEWDYDFNPKGKTYAEMYPNDYTVSQIGAAKYDLNPSSFDVKSAKWSLVGMDRKYVVKGEEPKEWAPVFEGISVEDGVATVQFSIENPDSLYAGVMGAFKEAADDQPRLTYVKDERKENNVPVMKLVAELEEGKTVSSDWHAIMNDWEYLSHLAFAEDNDWTTNNSCEISDEKDLYTSAISTAYADASVKVKYNGGPIDLAELITIHANEEYTLAEWNAKYPGFTFNFEEVPYTIGKNLTSEDMYGQIEGSEFTPCYVESKDGKPVSVVIAKDSESKEGISSVGRMPIVLVTLTDAKGIVTKYGYFKILITKDAPKPIEPKFLEVPSFGTVPFVCTGIKMSTTWDVFSFYVLEKLGVDYDQFIKTYTWDEKVYAYEPKIGQDGKVVVKDGKEVTELVDVDNKYGKVTYTPDQTGTGINDAFTWNVQSKKIGEGKSKSVYLKFVSATEVVYFELKADVAKAASFDFGANKIANEWFDDIDNEAKNTVRINVLVPNTNSDNVKEFYRDLNKFYIGYKPAVAIAEDADPVYSDKAFEEKLEKELVTKSEFYFDAEQPAIVDGDNWWVLCTNGETLYTAAVDAKGNLMPVKEDSPKNLIDLTGNYLFNEPIASINPATGVVTYYYDEKPVISKTLLNLWSYTEKTQAKMLYANILVKTTYGSNCEIPAGEEKFHVRFVRPIDVNFTAQDVAEESAVGGANVLVAKFISGIVDWNKQNVIIKEKDSKGKETGYYVANVIKDVDMYKYYGFSKVTIDLENAERDGHEISDPTKRELVSKVYPGDERLLIGTVNDKDIFTETGNNVIDITDLKNLKGVAINYQNNRSVIGTFNIYIPVSIEYAWGTIESELVIKIKPTSETGGK